jgi:hypothetical protein
MHMCILYTNKLGICPVTFDEFVNFSLDMHEQNFLNDRHLKLYFIIKKSIFKILTSVFGITPAVVCQVSSVFGESGNAVYYQSFC